MQFKLMRKSYSINQSPLYAIKGLNQLEKVLNIQLNKIGKLLNPAAYKVWQTEKGREIQYPTGWLGNTHKNIALLLARIEMPEYVYSKRGRSYADNGYEHIGYHPLAKTDIDRFYPSTTRDMVKKMFIDQFKCAKDVAGYLTDICCYQQNHLPTGSSISGYIAYFANKPLFDKVYELAKSNGCTFTLYVDDLTFSGRFATGKLIYQVRKLIRNSGLNAKRSKTKVFTAYAVKEVTGNIVRGNNLLLPNRRHKNIYETKQALAVTTNQKEILRLYKKLNGQIKEFAQIKSVNNGAKLEKEMVTELIFA
jgi:Reverse transcriptase (RNA-dependent DNA polymerase)